MGDTPSDSAERPGEDVRAQLGAEPGFDEGDAGGSDPRIAAKREGQLAVAGGRVRRPIRNRRCGQADARPGLLERCRMGVDRGVEDFVDPGH